MSLKIKTNIVKINDNTNVEDELLNNNIRSCFVTGATNLFKADVVEVKEIPFDKAQAASLVIDLFNTISIAKDKLTFLHVVCETQILKPADVKDPISFNVTFDAATTPIFLGKTSQFQMLDISSFVRDVRIDGMVLATDKEAILTIIAGGNL